jgi:hypothetical protein
LKKLLTSIIILLLTVSPVFAWYDADYELVSDITIDNTANPLELTDFEVVVNVTKEPEMNSDFSDLTFVDDDDSTVLSHWFHENHHVNDSYVTVYVKVPTIPASSEKTIYMYFNNSNDTTLDSNGDNVFEFFDDFNDYGSDHYGVPNYIHYNLTKWDRWHSRPYVRSGISNDYLYLQTVRTDNSNTGLYSDTNYYNTDSHPLVNKTVVTRMRSVQFPLGCVGDDNDPTGYFPGCKAYYFGYSNSHSSYGYEGLHLDDGLVFDGGWFHAINDSAWFHSTAGTQLDLPVADNVWHDIQTNYIGPTNGGTWELYWDGTLNDTQSRAHTQTGMELGVMMSAGGDTNGGAIQVHYDYVYVQDYADPAPSVVLGASHGPPPPMPVTETLTDVGAGVGNMMLGFAAPMMILILLLALGAAIGYLFAGVSKSIGSEV